MSDHEQYEHDLAVELRAAKIKIAHLEERVSRMTTIILGLVEVLQGTKDESKSPGASAQH